MPLYDLIKGKTKILSKLINLQTKIKLNKLSNNDNNK